MLLALFGFILLFATQGSYVKRPKFKKPFPDPALFHQSGRRLAADGEKPERLHFEVEDGGYHFSYDFGGVPTVERVFNLDSDGVEAISCTQGLNYDHLTVFWSNPTVAEVANLQKDVVISGAPEWGCGLSRSSRKNSESTNFLLRIIKVDRSASASNRSTELQVLPVSPVQLFRNLYMDLSWYQVDQSYPSDRRLTVESCGDYEWGLNYDCQSELAKEVYSLGPLECSNCYALLNAAPGFTLETDGKGSPSSLSMTLSATLEINFEVKYNSISSDDTWKTLVTGDLSDNLLNKGITFVLPMFGSLVSAINDWTVSMGIYVTYSLKGQADLQSSLDGILQTRQVVEWSGASVTWTKGSGLSSVLGTFTSTVGNITTPSLTDFAADLRAALAPCAGLALNYGDDTMSDVSACLEGHMAYVTEKANTSVAADAIAATSQVPDAELCVDIYQFETDGDLDTLSSDEPYAGWCFFGKCHYRDVVSFSGNTATWGDGYGYVCMEIQKAWLQTNSLYLGVWEDDPLWDDVYIERHAEDLSHFSNETTETEATIDCSPTSASGGSYAKLKVKLRLTTSSSRLLQTATCGQSLYFGPGMHGGLSGFELPSAWSHAGTKVIDSISLPSYRGQMSSELCEDLPSPTTTTEGSASISFSQGMTGMNFGNWANFLVAIWAGAMGHGFS